MFAWLHIEAMNLVSYGGRQRELIEWVWNNTIEYKKKISNYDNISLLTSLDGHVLPIEQSHHPSPWGHDQYDEKQYSAWNRKLSISPFFCNHQRYQPTWLQLPPMRAWQNNSSLYYSESNIACLYKSPNLTWK